MGETVEKKDIQERLSDIQGELFDIEALMKVLLEYCYGKEGENEELGYVVRVMDTMLKKVEATLTAADELEVDVRKIKEVMA